MAMPHIRTLDWKEMGCCTCAGPVEKVEGLSLQPRRRLNFHVQTRLHGTIHNLQFTV
jgi:hypothetical protein